MGEVNIQKVAKADDRQLPIFEEAEQMMQRIRERAFSVFAGHGAGSGDALSDWLTAEHELCGAASELVEQDHSYGLNVALPGFQPKDISVTATPRELIVSAKTEATRGDKTKEKGLRVCWSEFRSSDAYRRVELPADIQVAKVTANFENGLLKINAPKAQKPAKK
jgi:HSP20 family molecular chaperone IbpA